MVRRLRISSDGHRFKHVKAEARVRKHATGNMAIFHGPRGLSDYAADGTPLTKPMERAA
ncbi:MAG: hypothetical protein Fur0039_16860 [Rhodocyclaceae bacterium]